ncbi:hypothetical protein [Fictibacillus sp. JL2B1089]|uniref:hypothetical protein n=1 Tax=Fictibacillus sp. JL2B1089 TaxID=3399565 RepID=UPI003A891634
MFKFDFDEAMIEQISQKIADRAYEKLVERFDRTNNLPYLLTRTEAKELLRCGETKMSELFARPDFPINTEFGKRVPTKLLFKWIEQNTRWVKQNTNYFDREVV